MKQPSTATAFLDHYEQILADSAHIAAATRHSVSLGSLVLRSTSFRELRKQLRFSYNVSDEAIVDQIGKILAIIMDNLGDFLTIHVLVMPLFPIPAPSASDATPGTI